MKVQEYKEKLLGEILLANSQEDVKRLIKELDLFSPIKKCTTMEQY
jgi:hypothetical protein